MKFIDLNKQYQRIKDKTLSNISSVLEKGDFILGDDVYDLDDDEYKEKCPDGIYYERYIENVTKEDTKKKS